MNNFYAVITIMLLIDDESGLLIMVNNKAPYGTKLPSPTCSILLCR